MKKLTQNKTTKMCQVLVHENAETQSQQTLNNPFDTHFSQDQQRKQYTINKRGGETAELKQSKTTNQKHVEKQNRKSHNKPSKKHLIT